MWKLSKRKIYSFFVVFTLFAVLNMGSNNYLVGRSLKSKKGDTTDLPCCGVWSKRCVWTKVPPYTIPKCEQQNLLDLLRWLDYVLDVEWMITAGTVLGAVREQGHIPFETDIDIMMDRKDWEVAREQIKSRLKGTHFQFYDSLRTSKSPAKLYYSRRNQVHVDIWFYDRVSDDIIAEVMPYHKQYKKVNVTADIFLPRSHCLYNGHFFPCPNQSERYVELRYGKDWRTPKPKYSPDPLFKDGDDNSFILGVPKDLKVRILSSLGKLKPMLFRI